MTDLHCLYDQTESLIHGFIRKYIEPSLIENEYILFHNIPSLVLKACILYSQTTLMEIALKSKLKLQRLREMEILGELNRYKKRRNKMRQIYVERVVISCCVGADQQELQKAANILKQSSGQNAVKYGAAKRCNKGFGIRKNEKISCYVTVRNKEKVNEILERALKVKEYHLEKNNFTENGIIQFGIEEHIDLGLKYHKIDGFFGLNFSFKLTRNGCNKSKKKQKIKTIHKISREEAMLWYRDNFAGIIVYR